MCMVQNCDGGSNWEMCCICTAGNQLGMCRQGKASRLVTVCTHLLAGQFLFLARVCGFLVLSVSAFCVLEF